MSWSINLVGCPAKLSAALDAESQRLTGDSKIEFDEALPHMKGLLAMNTSDTEVLRFSGNGHAHGAAEKRYSCCRVQMEGLSARLVT